MVQLTSGSIKALSEDDKNSPAYNNPVVQIINLRAVTVNGSVRHRVIVSDGDHFMQGMLAVQHASAVDDGTIKKLCILRLTESVCNPLNNKKVLVVLNFDVLQSDMDTKIGSPVSIDSLPTNTKAPAPTPAPTSNFSTTRPESSSSYGNQAGFSSANLQLEANLTPIRNLNPYQTRWHIKARVSQKTPIKEWHNAKGGGQLFSVNLLDQSGEIKATAFGDQVTRLYHVLEEGKVYYISKARVTMARKQFSNLNNEYELGLEPNTEIEACPESGNIPMMNFDFIKINDLVKHEANSYVDVLGVVTEDAGVSEIISKATGKPTKKRDLTIADDSGKSVRLTLWDPKDDGFDVSTQPIIACKGARVSEFNGRALSAGTGSLLKINPDIPEMQKLRRWYNERGQSTQFDSFSSAMTVGGNGEYRGNSTRITLQEAKAQNLGSSDRPDYFSFRGTVVFIKNENFAYPSCPTCKKKALLEETSWRCEKCQKSFPKPEYRYILTMSVEDATSQIYVSGFDDLGQAVLKTSANDLMELKETNGTAAHQIIAKAHYQTFNFKVRAKQETFNDIARTKFQCVDVQPIDYLKESQDLAIAIDQLLE
ncbi:hypothetical protein BD560DRAFT_365748 [Blakeslea trispora]|nr:hypothetical protein BD560DRAFT_365748 [Blakeslea trispora]